MSALYITVFPVFLKVFFFPSYDSVNICSVNESVCIRHLVRGVDEIT